MVFKNVEKNIQAAAYNGAHTVLKLISNLIAIESTLILEMDSGMYIILLLHTESKFACQGQHTINLFILFTSKKL